MMAAVCIVFSELRGGCYLPGRRPARGRDGKYCKSRGMKLTVVKKRL